MEIRAQYFVPIVLTIVVIIVAIFFAFLGSRVRAGIEGFRRGPEIVAKWRSEGKPVNESAYLRFLWLIIWPLLTIAAILAILRLIVPETWLFGSALLSLFGMVLGMFNIFLAPDV